jgi:NAD(P)-dependent dehydrogenase (short-subunit alcohol dehydrogenase family)
VGENKVWFITGAGRGMGTDIARAALDAGHSVVATGRDPERVAKAVGQHDRLLTVALDITDESAAKTAVEAAMQRFGRIDVLVNNAGTYQAGFFEEVSPTQFRAQIDTNFFGPLNVTRAVLPKMRERRSGQVVTITSGFGVIGAEFNSAYAASKFALEGWMESLTPEVAPFGIRCTVVEPGYFRTELLVEGASTLWPDQTIEDYAERTAQTIERLRAMNGQQAGDPAKLAAALVTVVDLPEPPVRWVAGADIVQGLLWKADQFRDQASAYPELSTTLAH